VGRRARRNGRCRTQLAHGGGRRSPPSRRQRSRVSPGRSSLRQRVEGVSRHGPGRVDHRSFQPWCGVGRRHPHEGPRLSGMQLEHLVCVCIDGCFMHTGWCCPRPVVRRAGRGGASASRRTQRRPTSVGSGGDRGVAAGECGQGWQRLPALSPPRGRPVPVTGHSSVARPGVPSINSPRFRALIGRRAVDAGSSPGGPRFTGRVVRLGTGTSPAGTREKR
jgi:hypothetical protein